jgi:hypothetical protein
MLWLSAAAATLIVAAPSHAEFALGLDIGLGGATITAPSDDVGDPTLLFGSSLTGPAFMIAGELDFLALPFLSAGVEVGVQRASVSGFAETASSSRTLTLRFTSLETVLRARLEAPLTVVRPFLGFGVGGRFGLSASATEERVGFASDEPAPSLATHSGLLLLGDLGIVIRAGTIDVPIHFRGARNVSYGTTTRDRLSDYESTAEPGDFEVDANWSYGFRVGARFRF